MKTTILVATTILGFALVHNPVSAQSGRNDPLQPAKEAKKNVDETEARVLQSLQEIERLSSQQSLGDWRNEKLVIDEFRTKLIPSLKKAATDLLTKKADFDKKFKLYQAAVQKAPAAFDAAAKQFQQYADQEEDMTFKENYLDMEQHARKWSKEMDQRHSRLDEMYKEVTEKTRFVEKSVLFLDRLDEFLQIYPDPDKAAEVQQYLQKLNNHIEQIRRAINSFKDFSKSITDPKSSGGTNEPLRSSDATSIPPLLQHVDEFRRTAAVNDLLSRSPESESATSGRVSAIGSKRYVDGTWFQMTLDGDAVLSENEYVTLYRKTGQSFTVRIRSTRGREVLAATQSHQPRVGELLSIKPNSLSPATAIVARR